MNNDDIFADTESDLTQIYPMPGGNKDDIQDLLKNEHQHRQQVFDSAEISSSTHKKSSGSLVDAASHLLILVAHVSNTLEARDTYELKMRVIEEINVFIEKTKQLGIDEKTRDDATYILCTAVDEAVLNTPWGRQSDWSINTLLSRYFEDVAGGQRFFEKLLELGSDPVRNHQLLKLMYYSLALGYQGRYRTKSDATEKLLKVRQWTAERIAHVEADNTADLSPHWKGISGLGFGLKEYVSGWLLAVFAALLLAGAFTYFLTSLNISTAAVNSQLVQLDVPAVERAKPKRIHEPLKATKRSAIKDFVSQGIIVASDNKLLIPGDNLFASGSTKVTDVLRVSLEKLGETLKEERGHFRITGHSDNVPLGFRSRQIYGSNQGLSQQRADAVAEILRPYLRATSRIETQGKGDSEPIADNKLAAGRAKNRRVEIDIFN